MFVTLVRFDLAYHGLFKCNLRRVADHPNRALIRELTDAAERALGVPRASEEAAAIRARMRASSIGGEPHPGGVTGGLAGGRAPQRRLTPSCAGP